MAPGSRARNSSTRARDRSAAFNSKEGFSVVAPISVTVPSSITGRKASSWARLKRWISSTKSRVACPCARRLRAASNTLRRSGTPEKIAEICSKCRSVAEARSRATVVLPVPGGPQKISEPRLRPRSRRVSAPPSPVRCSWPTTSSRVRGRSLSASGRLTPLSGAGSGGGAGSDDPNRSDIPA